MQPGKNFIFILAFLMKGMVAFATHIVGGELTYQYKGNNVYTIRLDLFIDCKNGNSQAIAQDATAFIGVYSGKTNKMLSGYPIQISRSGPNRVQKLNYSCISVAPNACVDHYWYESNLTLPPIDGGYILSFQRCCRNNSISNLITPGAVGANYWTAIPDARTLPDKKPNSSAVFKELPPNFLCTNTPLKFNHMATDADGDSLVYDLFWPYDGASQNQPRPDNGFNGQLANPPFPLIPWASGYETDIPIDANPELKINSQTGYLTMTPTKKGQFVVGIRVKEYRKGVLISETRRDYQFNVDECVIDVVASYFAPKLLCGYTHTFTNLSTGAQRFHWDFGVSGREDDTSNNQTPKFTFPGPGIYTIKLYAYKNNCQDSFIQELEVIEPVIPKLPADTTLCKSASILYKTNVVADSYKWSTGGNSNSILVSDPGQFWVEIDVNGCKWRDTVLVKYDNDVVQVYGDTFYCHKQPFSRKLSLNKSFAQMMWSTGEKTQSITVSNLGKYIVDVETANGCKSKDTAEISQFGEIKFDIRDTTVCPGYAVLFDTRSDDATYLWSNGGNNRTATYSNSGLHWVRVTRGLCYKQDSFVLRNFANEFSLGPDLRFCNKIDTQLSLLGYPFSSIVWNNEVTMPVYRITQPGQVKVTLRNSNNCTESDSLMVLLFPNPALDLGSDTVVCSSVNPILDAGPNMVLYKWNTGNDNRFETAMEPGEYSVLVVDKEGCKSSDTVEILKNPQLFPSIVYMPNAFTPDDNGLNDLYPDNKYVNIGSLYVVKLYNRWGEKIVEYHSPEVNWNGMVNGVPAPEGVYVYLVSWIGCDNVRRTLSGDFHLLR